MALSPIGRAVLQRLALVNNQLCFFLFAEHEVARELDRFSSVLDVSYSTDLFSDNPQAKRIHIPLSELRGHQVIHRDATFMAFFSTAYEIASSYYEQALVLVEKCNGVQRRAVTDNRPEHRFSRQLAAIIGLPVELVRTLEYLRQRRNHWVHAASLVSAGWRNLSLSYGLALNGWWGASCVPVDFSVSSLTPPGEDEAIALIKLLRLCVQKMDEIISARLTPDGVLELCARELTGGISPANRDVLRNRARKVRGIVRLKFGLSVTLTQAEKVMFALAASTRP
jgi:hypothetical protein